MPVRFLSQLMRNENEFPLQELKQMEQLIYEEKFVEALQKVEQLEKNSSLKEKELLRNKILRSLILTRMGNYRNGLELAQQAFKESQFAEYYSLQIEACISIAAAFFELGKLEKSLNVIKKGEKLLSHDLDGQHHEIIDKEAAFKFLRGKVFRKKGEFNLAVKNIEESLTIKQELGNRYEITDHLNILGIINVVRGDFGSALSYFQQSLQLFRELKINHPTVKILNNIGMIYREQGEFDLALDNYNQSLTLSENLGQDRSRAAILVNIGLIYWDRGEIDSALEFYKKGLDIHKQFESSFEIAICLRNIGNVYQIKGELDRALQFYQDSLAISEKIEAKLEMGFSFLNIGEIFHIMGDLDKATNYITRSLGLFKEIGNNIEISKALFHLILVAIERGTINQTQPYLDDLLDMYNIGKNKLIGQKYRLAKALILKESDRVIKKAEAQQIFEEIVQEDLIFFFHKVIAMLNLCDLLLQELRTSGSEEVLNELKEILFQLLDVAEEQNSFFWLAQTYWLQSRLALVELDIDQAQQLLTQARTIAETKGLHQIAEMISNEHTSLINQISTWQKFGQLKPSKNEIIELTQLEDLIERMIYTKLQRREEEIIEYAAKAKQLVEKLEKD